MGYRIGITNIHNLNDQVGSFALGLEREAYVLHAILCEVQQYMSLYKHSETVKLRGPKPYGSPSGLAYYVKYGCIAAFSCKYPLSGIPQTL